MTIGSAAFPENVLLADIYGDAMAAKGVKVTKKLNIGERPIYMAALKDGSIDCDPGVHRLDPRLPRHEGDGQDPGRRLRRTAEPPPPTGSWRRKYAAAQDSDTITVTKATADKYHLTSIADLKSVAKQADLRRPGAVPDPRRRHPGARKRLRRHVRDVHRTDARRHGHRQLR